MAKIVTDQLIFAIDASNKRSYEDGTGTSWYDLSASNLTGTLTNGPVFNVLNNGAINFDGTNDYADFGNDAVRPSLPFSLTTWVRWNSADGNDGICAASWDASTAAGFWCKKSTNNTLNMSFGDNAAFASSNRRSKNGTTALSINIWYHLSFVWRGSTDMSMYINGVDDGGSYDGYGGALNYGSNKPTRIATFRNNYSDLKIAQMLIYDKGLTLDEILQNYQATRGRFV